MKNPRKIISLIALLISLLLVISFYGCRTSKKIVEKSKVDIEKSELSIVQKDSLVNSDIKIYNNKLDSLSWSSYMKELNFSFNGLDNSDELEITKTDKGFKIKGKGTVNGKSIDNKKDSVNKSNNHQIRIENSTVRENGTVQSFSTENSSTINKNKESHTLGFTIGVLIALILLGVLMIYLCYRYLLNKK